MQLQEFKEILLIGQNNPKLRQTAEYKLAFNEARNAVMRLYTPTNLNGRGFAEKRGCVSILPLTPLDRRSTTKEIIEWCNNMAEHVGCHDEKDGYHCTEANFG